MGFFDNIFKRGKAYSDKRTPKYACELNIEGEKYLLEEFDIDFSYDNSRRYVPVYAVFADKLSAGLDAWVTQSSRRKDGTVKFFENNEELDAGALFSMAFYDANCTGYRKNAEGEKVKTTLFLSAKRIKMLEEEVELK